MDRTILANALEYKTQKWFSAVSLQLNTIPQLFCNLVSQLACLSVEAMQK